MQLGGWSVSWQGMKGRTTTGTTLRQALRKATAGSGITLRNAGADTAGDYRAEVGIWAGGERPYAEGHGDSKDLGFGAENARQLKALCARVKVCVAVLYSGRPLIITDQLPEVDAFVASWLPGTEAEGITDVLFGKGFSGRLPVSWPRSVADEPINSGDGKRALFPAGYGISPY
jgi:beta-glucosidase